MRRICLLIMLVASLAQAQGIVVDGDFSDWPAGASATTDPADDAAGQLDVTGLAAALTGGTLHVRLDIDGLENLQAGSQDTPDLSLIIEPDALPALELQCRGRTLRRVDTGQVLTWDAVRYAVSPTYAARSYEFRFDLSSLGSIGPAGVRLRLSGSDTLDAPLIVAEVSPDEPPAPAAADPLPMGTVRLASLNTLRTGLFSPTQAPRLSRLLLAADADIYLLQEEYNSSEEQLRAFFNALRPQGKGASWHVHKRGDTAIVSRWPLVDLPNYDSSYSAAAALADDGPIVIVSIHPKCCGFIGSPEDQRRIEQADLTARLIDEVRAGKHDGKVALAEAPVIIGGDWNLVGSRTPLDRLTEPQLPGMAEVRFVRAGAADTTTWRELDGLGFAPGRLDLIVYDAERLTPVGPEVWDTALMSPARLARLGLEPADSTGSDHYMLVTRFARKADR